MNQRTHKVRTPFFPTYSEVRHLLNIWQGVAQQTVRIMLRAIESQTGTPQKPVDWSDPDTWIAERLSGESQHLAQRMWQESNHEVNPRHIQGAYLFINGYDLLEPDAAGIYRLSECGQKFTADDATIMYDLDDVEGLLELLTLVAATPDARTGDLREDWSAFLEQYSKYGTPSTIQDTLRRRLSNLLDRGLVSRDGYSYNITNAGRDYLAAAPQVLNTKSQPNESNKRNDVSKALYEYNQAQQQTLRQLLFEMSPYQFEMLIGRLLEAMGYEDVTVTKESGDKGIDVVAMMQIGISTVKEVVQVKRYKDKNNIQRPTVDQLRGALPYHEALRGTIITTSDFSKGCTEAALFPNAAPITLINGERLIDLLVEHEIGIRKRAISLYEVDYSAFDTEALGADDES